MFLGWAGDCEQSIGDGEVCKVTDVACEFEREWRETMRLCAVSDKNVEYL